MKNVPFKRFLVNRNGGMWGSEPGSDESDVLCIRVADFDYENLKTKASASTVRSITEKQIQKNQLHDGDILLEKSGGGEKTPVGRAVYYSGNDDAICSNFIERLTVNQQTLNPKFACYILSAAYSQRKNLDCIKQTTGIQNLSVDDYLSSVTVPLFDIETQKRITKWLDKQLSKVAQVITAKQAQLQKLSSYRQSLITRAVTKGLDPNVEMKASGVQWIGNMPSHWRICRVKNLFSVVCGATPSPNPQYWNGNINWIGPSDMDEIGDVSSGKRSITREGYESCGTTLVPQGSLVLSTRAPVGKVNIAKGELCTNQGCKSLVPLGSKNYTKYYYFVLQAAKDQLIQDSSGTTFLELSTSALSDELLPLPSLDEQKRIVSFLEKIDEMVLELKVKLSDSIRLLNEYRSSLISAAVTGQLAIDEEASA